MKAKSLLSAVLALMLIMPSTALADQSTTQGKTAYKDLNARTEVYAVTQTPASHLMQLVHVSRWNLSHVRVRVWSVRAASSNNTAEPKYDMLVSSMTYIAHNSLVFYSCI